MPLDPGGWRLFPALRALTQLPALPPRLLALSTENVVRKLFVFRTFSKAYFKIIIDGIVALGQLTEKAVRAAR